MNSLQPVQVKFVGMIRQVIIEKQFRNPLFSLRAFARQLHLSPSSISEILRGKRRVSKKSAARILDGLHVNPDQAANWLSNFPEKHTRKRFPAAESKYEQLDMDQYQAIAEWYHFALLSLLDTSDFRSSPRWIARRLRITEVQARKAIERLVRLRLIKKKGRILSTTGQKFITSDNISNLSLKKAHSRNLELADNSLQKDEVDVRDFTAITMAIDPKKLREAKRLIRKFRERISYCLERGEKREVYKMCVQLFPLTSLGGKLR